MIDFTQYLPQRIFLVQGDQSEYETLTQSLQERYELVHGLSVSRFTVDHAKTVAHFALEGDGSERVMVVYFSIFSPDAAQVLLKALEEPDTQTTMVLMTPYPYVVPLTIRSRVGLIQTTRADILATVRTRAEALEYIKKELSSDGEEDAATRRALAVQMLDELEVASKADPRKALAIYEAKHMLFKANLPTKFVMEYVVTAVL
jgi:DNA polymerase III delta prime subunit